MESIVVRLRRREKSPVLFFFLAALSKKFPFLADESKVGAKEL